MKTILFATTALVASAGIAAADISFSGSAEAGVASEAGGTADVYSFADLVVTMTGESDIGISFGASLTTDAGYKYDIGDFEFDGEEDGKVSLGNVYIAAGGAKLTFDHEGIDDLYDDDMDDHDVQFSYAMGAFSADLTFDADEDNVADVDADGDAEYSYSLAYSANGLSASVTGNDLTDMMVFGVSYDVNDMLTVGAEYDLNGGSEVATLMLGYAANGFSADLEFSDDDSWEVAVGYTAGAISIAAETDHDEEWEVTGAYDFGGGLSAVAGVDHEEDYFLGVKMSF